MLSRDGKSMSSNLASMTYSQRWHSKNIYVIGAAATSGNADFSAAFPAK
jgi:hypothetical protein